MTVVMPRLAVRVTAMLIQTSTVSKCRRNNEHFDQASHEAIPFHRSLPVETIVRAASSYVVHAETESIRRCHTVPQPSGTDVSVSAEA